MLKRKCSTAAAAPLEEAIGGVLVERGRTPTAAYAALLRRCGQERAIEQGRRLHGYLLATRRHDGSFSFLANLLVQMYGRCGSTAEARAAFDSIPRRNVYSWSLLMGVYADNRQSQRTLQVYWEMLQQGICPENQVVFLLALVACSQLGLLRHGRTIHDHVLRAGLTSDELDSAVVNMYGKCGSVAEAEAAFQKTSSTNVATWTAMIAAYALAGQPGRALDLFAKMDALAAEHEQLRPNYVTFLAVVDAVSSLGSLSEARTVYNRIIADGLETQTVLGNALIGMFAKCGSYSDAWRVFCRMDKNVVSWNTMISAYTQSGHNRQALQLYQRMEPEGVKANAVTYTTVLGLCSVMCNVQEGGKLHSRVVEAGYVGEVIVQNALLNMYGKCSRLAEARKVFEELQRNKNSDLVSWNSIISAYAQNGLTTEALGLFDRMVAEAEMVPDAFTFTSVLDACSRNGDLEKGRAIHRKLVSMRIEADGTVGNALVTMYGKCSRVAEAKAVFDGMQQKDVVAWTAMVTAFCQNGEGRQAIKVYKSMDVAPNEVTFISTLDACSMTGDLREGRRVHQRLAEHKLAAAGSLGNALLNMYAKCGSLDEASSLFDCMEHRNLVSWSTLAAAYAHHGHGSRMLDLLEELCLQGMTPDEVTFVNVLVGCSHSGLLDEGRSVFVAVMRDDWCLEPHFQHYKCMVDLLARAGWLDEAGELMASMPFEADEDAWMTLLGSCRVAGNLLKGVGTGNMVISSSSGPYVMLSNVVIPQ